MGSCQIIGDRISTAAVAADDSTCQNALQEVPGLSGATVDVTVAPSTSSGVGGVDLLQIEVKLPKGVDGSGLSASLTGAILASSQSNPLSGNEYLYRRHWRNNNGRSFTVTKLRENRVGAITSIEDGRTFGSTAPGKYRVTHDADIHGMAVPITEFVAVHNIPNARISQSHQLSENSATKYNIVRGEIYEMGNYPNACQMVALESHAAGDDVTI